MIIPQIRPRPHPVSFLPIYYIILLSRSTLQRATLPTGSLNKPKIHVNRSVIRPVGHAASQKRGCRLTTFGKPSLMSRGI